MAVDYFLKIDGITGDAPVEGHEGEIQIESWSWGVTNSGTMNFAAAGAGAGRATIQDLNFTARMSRASPFLFEACASGRHIKSARLTALKASASRAEDFLAIELESVIVSSYQTGAPGGTDGIPIDMFSLSFGKMTMDYKEQTNAGKSMSAGRKSFDLRSSKAS